MLAIREVNLMKILIRKDALKLYIEDNTDWSGDYFGDDEWERVISQLEGKEVEVDTEMLFKDEFNTTPIPGISEEGIRIPEEYVEKVIDDQRYGKARCEFCNNVSNSIEVCTHCGRSDYLEVLMEEDESF